MMDKKTREWMALIGTTHALQRGSRLDTPSPVQPVVEPQQAASDRPRRFVPTLTSVARAQRKAKKAILEEKQSNLFDIP